MKKIKKRFKSMRVSMILMIMAVVTSCIVGGTYAKYICSNTGVDNARVAKFGVVIEANGTAFSNAYDSKERGTVKSVLSTDNVIAPGTSGRMISMVVSGKPEVSIEVKYTANFSVYNWEVIEKNENKVFYCPITITVGDIDIVGTNFTSANEFEMAVNEAIENFSDVYFVENFGESADIKDIIKVPSVSWRWDFEGDNINNEYDTYLGNRACEQSTVGENNTKSTINLIITTTVTQIN